MKKALLATVLLIAGIAGLFAGYSTLIAGQDDMPSPEKMQEMMEKWMATLTPGEHHRKLDVFVGDWDIVMKMWWGGPNAPANESKGTATARWILDKHFVMEEVKWNMMMPDPKNPMAMNEVPVEGLAITGYDNYRNVYVSSWMDSMATHMITSRGSADPSGKRFAFYGEMDEPMLDVTGRTVKYVNEVVSEDKHVFSIYDLHAGDDYKVLEITYTRKK